MVVTGSESLIVVVLRYITCHTVLTIYKLTLFNAFLVVPWSLHFREEICCS